MKFLRRKLTTRFNLTSNLFSEKCSTAVKKQQVMQPHAAESPKKIPNLVFLFAIY